MNCSETRSVQTHFVTYKDLNFNDTLFGGQMMAWIDETAGISAVRIAREGIVTASVDHLDFLAPIRANHSVCIDTFVSGIGTRSMEVFAKVIGEDLLEGTRYLAGTCFLTFVVPKGKTLPVIKPQTKEEKFICAGYEKRKKTSQMRRQDSMDIASQIDLTLPWRVEE
ncbi:acyl-CoA thioesterase [Enterococcus sp. LJL99]